jgi:hypothetical protein
MSFYMQMTLKKVIEQYKFKNNQKNESIKYYIPRLQ